MEIDWREGKKGALLGYVQAPQGEETPADEAERPEFVIKPMIFPTGFTLYRNDYNLGPYLFLDDLGRHPTLDEAKQAAEGATAT